jgi:hypothetical protein
MNKTQRKVKDGIQKQLQNIPNPAPDAKDDRVPENQIDREIEALRDILMSVNSLKEDEKKRVFSYLKNRYSSAWPGENY